jgi:hypothetical protein
MGYRLGFNSQQGGKIFLYFVASRLAPGFTHPFIQWMLRAVFPWRMQMGMKLTTHFYPVLRPRIVELYFTPPYVFMSQYIINAGQRQVYHSHLYLLCTR